MITCLFKKSLISAMFLLFVLLCFLVHLQSTLQLLRLELDPQKTSLVSQGETPGKTKE